MSLKTKILEKCISLQQEKVDICRRAMEEAQESANSEEKSSAGDKYETSRAMNQNTRDMNAKHMTDALHILGLLKQINPEREMKTAETGALVFTSVGNYFLSVSLGQVEADGVKFFAVSPVAPVSQSFLGKKKGATFQFQGKKAEILEIR